MTTGFQTKATVPSSRRRGRTMPRIRQIRAALPSAPRRAGNFIRSTASDDVPRHRHDRRLVGRPQRAVRRENRLRPPADRLQLRADARIQNIPGRVDIRVAARDRPDEPLRDVREHIRGEPRPGQPEQDLQDQGRGQHHRPPDATDPTTQGKPEQKRITADRDGVGRVVDRQVEGDAIGGSRDEAGVTAVDIDRPGAGLTDQVRGERNGHDCEDEPGPPHGGAPAFQPLATTERGDAPPPLCCPRDGIEAGKRQTPASRRISQVRLAVDRGLPDDACVGPAV